MLGCYLRQHCLMGIASGCIVIMVVGVGMMAGAGNGIERVKDSQKDYIAVDLLQLENETYLATIPGPGASVNCTLRDAVSANVTTGYLYNDCILQGRVGCVCSIQLPQPDAALDRILWSGMGIMLGGVFVFLLVNFIDMKLASRSPEDTLVC